MTKRTLFAATAVVVAIGACSDDETPIRTTQGLRDAGAGGSSGASTGGRINTGGTATGGTSTGGSRGGTGGASSGGAPAGGAPAGGANPTGGANTGGGTGGAPTSSGGAGTGGSGGSPACDTTTSDGCLRCIGQHCCVEYTDCTGRCAGPHGNDGEFACFSMCLSNGFNGSGGSINRGDCADVCKGTNAVLARETDALFTCITESGGDGGPAQQCSSQCFGGEVL